MKEQVYNLKSTSLRNVNIPSDIIKELGWKINEEVLVIISGIYSGDGKFSHNTISIGREKDEERLEDYDNKLMEKNKWKQ